MRAVGHQAHRANERYRHPSRGRIYRGLTGGGVMSLTGLSGFAGALGAAGVGGVGGVGVADFCLRGDVGSGSSCG